MGFMDRIAGLFGYAKAAQAQYPSWALSMADAGRYAIPDPTSLEGQQTLYANLTALSTAVDFLANSAAPLEVEVYKREGEGETEVINHAFELLLEKPNPAQSRFEFQRDIVSNYGTTGNAYIWLNKASEFAEPTELWPIPSRYITPVPDGRMYIKGYLFNAGNGKQPLEPWEVLHVKTYNPFSSFVGLSPVQSLMLVGNEDIAKQRYKLNFFSKDNAVIPGALAFADMVPDSDWQKLDEDIKRQWGAGKRSGPLKLRGVGTGGVQWVAMSMSDKELDFLGSRAFTRDEIWSKLAPGLASILSPNATEANAIAGKATFAEYALWPMLSLFASKYTQAIMPAYGEGLIAKYEDPRQSNRLVDLQEQQEYAKTHTVAEIRSEYYGDDPLGDERDNLLPSEVGKSAPPAPMQPGPVATEPVVTDRPEAMTADMAPEIEAELKAWHRFELKRLGNAKAREFEPRALPLLKAASIKTALRAARTRGDIDAIFGVELSGGDLLARAVAVLERGAA